MIRTLIGQQIRFSHSHRCDQEKTAARVLFVSTVISSFVAVIKNFVVFTQGLREISKITENRQNRAKC